MTLVQMLLVVCPLVFFASFVDSIAGGGGLISLPAFMLTGIPIHIACGSNKFSACAGSIISAIRYYKNGKIHLPSAVCSGVLSLLGAMVGANINLMIPNRLLANGFMLLLPVIAIFVLFRKEKVRTQMLTGWQLYVTCALIGFLIGTYDGLIGPGTGTFLIFAYTSFVGFDYVTASGNAKIANLCSNLSSAIVYSLAGVISFQLAVPAMFCSILGGWVGSGMAIHKGSRFIRGVLICVLLGIFVKLSWDLYTSRELLAFLLGK